LPARPFGHYDEQGNYVRAFGPPGILGEYNVARGLSGGKRHTRPDVGGFYRMKDFGYRLERVDHEGVSLQAIGVRTPPGWQPPLIMSRQELPAPMTGKPRRSVTETPPHTRPAGQRRPSERRAAATRRAGVVALGAALLLLPACAAGERSAPASTVRDSAGVEIIESAGPQWRGGVGWRLSAEPLLEIGREDGGAMLQFDELAGVVRLPDGGVVVANGGDNTLRWYDAAGAFMRAGGGRGGGPTELRSLSTLVLHDGLLYAGGFGTPVQLWDADGRHVRSIGWPTAVRARFAGVLADGTILLHGTTRQPDDPPAPRWAEKGPWIALREGAAPDTIAWLAQEARDQVDGDIVPVLFGGAGFHDVRGDVFVQGFSDRLDVGVYTAEGRLRRRVRRTPAPPPVTAAEREALFQALIRSPEAELENVTPEILREMMARMPISPTMPDHGALLLDAHGALWAQRVNADVYARTLIVGRPAPTAGPTEWDVFDAAGAWLGSVAMPPGFLPLEIGHDYVAGVHANELGIERVRVYELSRG
jgi:hypothetical protein